MLNPSVAVRPPFALTPLRHAIALALCGAVAWSAVPSPALAQAGTAQAQPRSYRIAAGPLAPALHALASEAGVALMFTPAQTDGKITAGLNGNYTLAQAYATLLSGSGLQAVLLENGSYVLRAAPPAAAPADHAAATTTTATATLAIVNVRARRAVDGSTEGTGSYTSRVTSIASKGDQSFREIPQSVSVVTRQQIDDRRMLDIRDALAATPGITVSQLNFQSSYFYSRGFKIDSMQIDGGAPLNIGDYGYSVNQNMDFYDRVEVMRGASGLLGGVGDPGGIINIARKKPLAESRLVIEQSVGSWDQYRTMVDVTAPLTQDGRVRGRAVLSYLDSDYHVDIKHTRSPQLYGVIEADLTPATLLTLGASRAKVKNTGNGGGDLPRYSDGGDIGLPRHTSFTQPWSQTTQQHTEFFGALEHQFANRWKFKFNATHVKWDGEGGNAFGWGAVDRISGSGTAWYGGQRYLFGNSQTVLDASLAGIFQLAGRKHEVLVGLDRQKVESFSNTAVTSSPLGSEMIDIYHPGAWNPVAAGADKFRFNPWGQQQHGGYGVLRLHPTDQLHVIAGARYAKYRFDQQFDIKDSAGSWSTSSASHFTEPAKLTPYGGVIYDLGERWSAYVSYATILKPQALYKTGPLPGASLAPIKGNSYEAGLKGELADGLLNATFSLFNVERTGTAVRDARYPSSSDPYAGTCCFLPQGTVTSRGFDAEIGGELRQGWQGAAGYTYSQTRDKSTDAPFSSITPRHLFKLSTAYTLAGDWSQWKVGGSAHIQSKHYVTGTLYDAAGAARGSYDFTQRGYAVWNAMVQYRIDPRWTVSLNVNNVFDKWYYETVGDASGGNFYGTPRNATLTLRAAF